MRGYRVGVVASGAQVALFANKESRWIQIEICYLISSRNELNIGSFSISSNQLLNTAQNYYLYKHSLPNWQPTSNSLFPFVHISGIKTRASPIRALRLFSVEIDSNLGELRVTLFIDTNAPIERLSFSYLWWKSDIGLPFTVFDPLKGSSAAYQFTGIRDVSDNVFGFTGNGFEGSGQKNEISCFGPLCQQNCISVP